MRELMKHCPQTESLPPDTEATDVFSGISRFVDMPGYARAVAGSDLKQGEAVTLKAGLVFPLEQSTSSSTDGNK